VVTLVAWLIVVSEANCVKQAGSSFLIVSSSFPCFKMREDEEVTKKLVVLQLLAPQ